MNTASLSRSFHSSELSRNAREVFTAAEEQPVSVTRRDGEDLVLMSRREADAREQLLQFAAQLVAVSTSDEGTIAERMANMFPWMLALTAQDQALCANELISAARASFSTGQAHLAATELIAWQETAAAIASGLGRAPVDWIDSKIVVEHP